MSQIIRLLVMALVALSACAPAAQAQETQLQIIASTSILADVARAVAGDAAVVESLFPLGANAHTAEPSAQDVARLSDADLVLTVGLNYEEGLLTVLEEAAGDKVAVVSQCVPVLPVSAGEANGESTTTSEDKSPDHTDLETLCAGYYETIQSTFGLTEISASPDAMGPLYAVECPGHDHEGEAHAGEDIHEAGSCDPHVWTDPVNVALWTLTIRDLLSERDPAHADLFAANADTYLAELAAADADVRAAIESIPANNRFIITNHQTLGYFAARYGLSIVGVIIPGGSTTSEPSVQATLGLIQVVQDYQVPAIFAENVVSDSLAGQIAEETGAQVVTLYTESLSEAGAGADTYLNYIRFNANTLADALK
ncbi:MAG TPA: metal ABC transporter substrate-binding protein [Aggregatilineaceae bacterium]|nr:metal ABC transporter substrate-binding protein [Aggregatilineaceae bacterium]